MNKTTTPGEVRSMEGLGPLVDAEMVAYYDGEYMDHSTARARLRDFARALLAAERERCAKLCRAMMPAEGVIRRTLADLEQAIVDGPNARLT